MKLLLGQRYLFIRLLFFIQNIFQLFHPSSHSVKLSSPIVLLFHQMMQYLLPILLLFLLPFSVIFVLSFFHFFMPLLSICVMLQPCSMPLYFLFHHKPLNLFNPLSPSFLFEYDLLSRDCYPWNSSLHNKLSTIMFSLSQSPLPRLHSLRSQQQVLLDNWLLSSSFGHSSPVPLDGPASFLFVSLLFPWHFLFFSSLVLWLVLHWFSLPICIKEICGSHFCLGLTQVLLLWSFYLFHFWLFLDSVTRSSIHAGFHDHFIHN